MEYFTNEKIMQYKIVSETFEKYDKNWIIEIILIKKCTEDDLFKIGKALEISFALSHIGE